MTGFRLLLLILLCTLSFAQKEASNVRGDKSDGEERAIEERENWFAKRHGLLTINRPDLRREAAAKAALMERSQEVMRAFRAGWTELGPSPMNMLNWTMGRVAGRVTAIAVDPSNREILYLAAAGGGLWKTTNGGSSWTCLSNDLGTQSIGALMIDPNQTSILWVGTGEHASSCTGYFGMGLFKSTDGGSSFTAMNGQSGHSLDLSFISSIASHPSQSQVLLVGGHGFCSDGSRLVGGIYRSTDGGQNWDKVLSGEVSDILSDPNDPSVFYTAVGRSTSASNGVYKSLNGGATWSLQTNGIDSGTSISKLRLAMAPSDSNILYAFSGNGKVFMTTDSGSNWTQTGSGACEGQCTYNLCLSINPTTPTTLLLGSIRFSISTNSGANRSFLTSSWGSNQKVHQDTHVLLYDRTDPNKFWVGSDGGIWRSDDGGSTFTNLNSNLNLTQFYDIAVAPDNRNRIFGGAQDNSSLGTDNDLVWEVNEVTGDGFMNLVDPLNTQIVYQTSYPSGNGSSAQPSLLRSTTGGTPNSFNYLNMTGVTNGPFPWVTPIAITSNLAGTDSYVFVGSNKVFMSSDDGDSWRSLTSTALSNNGFSISVIEPVPSQSGLLVFVGDEEGRIFKSSNALDNSPSWENVTGNYPLGVVSDIAIDAANQQRVFVTRGAFSLSKLYRSTTGGTSWTAVGDGLPDVPANSVAIDPLNSNRIFVGTDVGVYESTDGGDHFSTMMLGMPVGSVVMDLEISSSPHLLTAGTYGRGAWSIELTTAELVLETGPDRVICLGDPTPLNGVASNGVNPVSYLWSIVSGPDTSLSQFDDLTIAQPVFTATQSGDYVLNCQVTDGLNRTSDDSLGVFASTVALYSSEQRLNWSANANSQGWEPRYDRNSNGWVEILDLLLQLASPTCY